jgi:hypothetical protein
MKSISTKLVVILAALALAGCSNGSSLLNSKSNVPQASNIPVGNALAMPPDLQLAVPNQTSENYEPNGPVEPVAPAANVNTPSINPKQQIANAPLEDSGAPVPVKQDIYDQYGVSKFDANGKPKKPDILKAELKAAIIKKKRETNPNYGTIANIGAIFNDQ